MSGSVGGYNNDGHSWGCFGAPDLLSRIFTSALNINIVNQINLNCYKNNIYNLLEISYNIYNSNNNNIIIFHSRNEKLGLLPP